MTDYKLYAGLPSEQKKIGKLKYLVMIFEKGGCNEHWKPMPDKFSGFLNDKCQHIVQYFTGREKLFKKTPLGKVVSLPHLFDTKKQATETIKQSRKHDKAFKRNNIYKIVPIDIKN